MHRGRGGSAWNLLQSWKTEVQQHSPSKSQATEVPVRQRSPRKEDLWQESPDKWATSIWDESSSKQGACHESPRKQGASQVTHSKADTHPASQDVWQELPCQQVTRKQARPQGGQQESTAQPERLADTRYLNAEDMKMMKQFEDASKLFESMTISSNRNQGQTQNPFASKALFGMMNNNNQSQRGSEDPPASNSSFGKVASQIESPATQGASSKQDKTSCICNRPKKRIWCKKCGSLILGRINIVCQKHTQVMYLSDHRSCWNCKASLENLMELEDDVVLPGAKSNNVPLRKNHVTRRQE